MKTALVTGSEGFIGTHIVNRLHADGWIVAAVDIRKKRKQANILRPMPPMDCRDFFKMPAQPTFDLAIHCAAVIPNIEDRGQNAMPVAGNLELDAAFFQWVMTHQPHQSVYFSSSAAYPAHLHSWSRGLQEDDIDLDDLAQPNEIYGFTKLAGEIQAREVRRQGASMLVVRPQTVYGPGQSFNYPFPNFIQRARHGSDPFEVWGSGKQGRDFIHVSDAVDSIMAMLERDAQGPLNIGSGTPTSMIQLATMICDAAELVTEIECLPDKPDGATCLYADVRRMHDYHDHRFSLEEGIREALDA